MVIVNDGLTAIINLLSSSIDKGEAGRDDTLPSKDDTNLIDPVPETLLSVTVTTSDNVLNVHYVIPHGTTTETLQEWGIFMGSTLLSRSVTAPITPESNEEITRETQIIVEGD